MRYLLTFAMGLLLGFASAFFIFAQTQPPALVTDSTASAPAAAEAVPVKSEEQILAERVGIEIKPINSPVEAAISAEPQHKSVPPLQAPPNMPADAIVIPVAGVERAQLRDMFDDVRGSRSHRAIDILAPRGTPVVAAIDGTVAKLFLSKAGGMTVYQYDPSKAWIYYYAHLDGYAEGLVEGQQLRRGDVIGFVGTSGNAAPDTPHLHFAIEKLTEPGRWWKSEPINPYTLLSTRGVTWTLRN